VWGGLERRYKYRKNWPRVCMVLLNGRYAPALQRDLGWNTYFKFLFSVDAERGRYTNLGVTKWDLSWWEIRQAYAAEARDGTKTILERVGMGPQGSRYVKVMDEWTQADIRRKGKRKKTAAKKRRRRRTQTRRSGETILV
jgi:hypothetical protein